MSGKPAARLGDSSSCPKTGHGNNPIASGSPDVFFDGLPAARAGDSTGCGSTLSSNLVPNVLINGKPAATLGSLGDHGSVVIGGSGTVIIGTSHTPSPFVPPEPLNIATSAHAMLASPALPQRSAIPMARAWQEEPGDLAPLGLEQEDEEEELGDQPQQLERQAITLRIGVFFDGTGNNAANSAIGAQCRAPALGLDEQEALAMVQRCEAHHLDPDSSYANDVSNIWRLYELYRDEPIPKEAGSPSTLRIYVTGIGTTSGKPDTLFPGQAFGRGETGVLAKVDEGLALLEKALVSFKDENPESALARLELDIFGFSRGAAAARHFANQVLLREQGPLGELRHAGKLDLAPGFDWRDAVVINFIGLFDTVAALGGWDDWGDPSDDVNGGIDLHLAPDAARQVVHLVARDEYRRNFALNQVSPPHREIVLPGAHSNLGGGYQPLCRERLYPIRPRSNWVSRTTTPSNTLAYQQAQQDTELARQADLLDPQDRAAQLGTDVWEHFMPFAGGRGDQMKYVLAAPYLERRVHGHLSRVYLRVMHTLAVEAGVPLDFIDEQDSKLSLPAELVPISGKLLAWARNGSGALDMEEERLLRQRYIHLSANWNATAGRGGSVLDVVFVNAPAERGRARHADRPQEKKR
ncbi:PAAR domain-containing protein [Stutzerimonas balearica]|uniref:PAAR domain-containing protein n=1 Tax=Stutzerimonas balearica TaxID=74829 RepID=UPI001BAF17BA|nr:PAAR domain-containing protein [Stutzerimonas balearica]WAN10211.1 PAAR domain-containing protein [Stutzerimonas balearica]